jgi:SAM-dependent methyltransferase
VSNFSAEWLDLREAADRRARNSEIANAVAARFALRDELRIVDLGSGTGANLRATAPLLPNRQAWTLVDNDPELSEAANAKLCRWADAAERDGETLRLKKGERDITVTFATADLANCETALLDGAPHLVTASAFFDLVSEDFIRRLAKAVMTSEAAFYAALTYNGLQKWTPHRPADNQMIAAFHRHQMRDKGFGPAAGPLAASQLADQFRLNGYLVLEGESPWQLERGDRMLIDELVRGQAVAVTETGTVDAKTIVAWINVPRAAALVGHTDTFAVPA